MKPVIESCCFCLSSVPLPPSSDETLLIHILRPTMYLMARRGFPAHVENQADADVVGIGVSLLCLLGMKTHMENLQHGTTWSR